MNYRVLMVQIKRAREESGMSCAVLGHALGASEAEYMSWEHSHEPPVWARSSIAYLAESRDFKGSVYKMSAAVLKDESRGFSVRDCRMLARWRGYAAWFSTGDLPPGDNTELLEWAEEKCATYKAGILPIIAAQQLELLPGWKWDRKFQLATATTPAKLKALKPLQHSMPSTSPDTLSIKPYHYTTTVDPVFNQSDHQITHWVVMARTRDLPEGIPNTPNARSANPNRQVYKKVAESLKSSDGKFHLKNKGITLIARSVQVEKDGSLSLQFSSGDGIVDGGHTYAIIREANQKKEVPQNQYVMLFIRTGVPSALYADISRGLNTAIQVKESSLANLGGEFDWLKEALVDSSFCDKVAWQENDKQPIKVENLIQILTAVNFKLFPDNSDAPLEAYSAAAKCLFWFRNKPVNYSCFSDIAADVFELHDYISVTSFNQSVQGRENMKDEKIAEPVATFAEAVRFGSPGEYGTPVRQRLHKPAILPILSAFRQLIEEDPVTGKARWKVPFEDVKAAWDRAGTQLLESTLETFKRSGENLNALGKDRQHWRLIYSELKSNLPLVISTPLGKTSAEPSRPIAAPSAPVKADSVAPLRTTTPRPKAPIAIPESRPLLSMEFLTYQHDALLEKWQHVSRKLEELENRPLRLEEHATKELHEEVLKNIELALGAINDGSYGSCKACATEIPTERLEAQPQAILCSACAAS